MLEAKSIQMMTLCMGLLILTGSLFTLDSTGGDLSYSQYQAFQGALETEKQNSSLPGVLDINTNPTQTSIDRELASGQFMVGNNKKSDEYIKLETSTYSLDDPNLYEEDSDLERDKSVFDQINKLNN